MSLDSDEPNTGYRLGRLFAVLENIQRSAQGDINVTIRDRYFSSAMTSPRSAFAELMRLKNAHLKKVRRSAGRSVTQLEAGIRQWNNGFQLCDYHAPGDGVKFTVFCTKRCNRSLRALTAENR